MTNSLRIIVLLMFFPLLLISQVEKKPLYAPRSEKHRNVYDAKGKQGTWKFFTQNSDLFLEVNYENDLKNGPCIRYYTSTAGVREEINYYYGVKEGDYKSYFVSGATKSEGEFKKNRRDGHWIFYHASTGEKSTEGDYINGKKNNEWIYYNRKGEMTCKGNYKNDAKDGVWHYYDSEGKELKSESFDKKEAPVTAQNANKKNKYIPSPHKEAKTNTAAKVQPLPAGTQVTSTTTNVADKSTNDVTKQPIAGSKPNTGNVIKEDSVVKKTNKAKINFTPSK